MVSAYSSSCGAAAWAESGARPGEEGDEAAGPSFGYLRGARDRALHVTFRRERCGDAVALPYSWLGPARFHPSRGIELLFVGGEYVLVTLRGRNLGTAVGTGIDLFESGFLRHRVTWVREVPAAESRALPETACVVDRIEVRVVAPEEAAQVLK
jgi:hypothetical protein